jgi:hypothetical protein
MSAAVQFASVFVPSQHNWSIGLELCRFNALIRLPPCQPARSRSHDTR